MTSVTVRVDEQTKRETTKIVEDFGFDLSSVTRAFTGRLFENVEFHSHCLTLNLTTESLQSIHEAEDILSNKTQGYASAEEMLSAAL